MLLQEALTVNDDWFAIEGVRTWEDFTYDIMRPVQDGAKEDYELVGSERSNQEGALQ
jgi:hypothetical protein